MKDEEVFFDNLYMDFLCFLSFLQKAFFFWTLAIGLLSILILDIDECESRDSNQCDHNALNTNAEGFCIILLESSPGRWSMADGVASKLILAF